MHSMSIISVSVNTRETRFVVEFSPPCFLLALLCIHLSINQIYCVYVCVTYVYVCIHVCVCVCVCLCVSVLCACPISWCVSINEPARVSLTCSYFLMCRCETFVRIYMQTKVQDIITIGE